MVSIQFTTGSGLPAMATILSVDSGQHSEYTLMFVPVFCGYRSTWLDFQSKK